MSTRINDFASAALLASGLAPSERTASVSGPAVDLLSADGPCFAVQHVGAVSGEPTLAGHVEQSPDGSTWAAISGATFTTVTAANDLQTIRFTRSARYVRWVGTVAGDDPSAMIAVLIGEQKKTI